MEAGQGTNTVKLILIFTGDNSKQPAAGTTAGKCCSLNYLSLTFATRGVRMNPTYTKGAVSRSGASAIAI